MKPIHAPFAPRPQAGFSIVELMVAVTLSLFVLAGMGLTLASGSESRVELDRALQQIENGRYAMQIVSQDLRHAGYYGRYIGDLPAPAALADPCAVDPAALEAGLGLPLQGYDAPATVPPELAGCLDSGNFVPRTDILVVRRAQTSAPLELAAAAPGEIYLQTTAYPSGPRYVVGDGGDTSVFTLEEKKADHSGDVVPAGLLRYHVHVYFVSPCDVPASGATCNGAADDGGRPIPTLKRLELTSDGMGSTTMRMVPLVQGVQDLQIDYGIDNPAAGASTGDGSPDSYVSSPAAVGDWANVVAVQLNLLAANTEPTPGHTDTKLYNLGLAGAVGPFNDSVKRHAYSAVVRVNNVSSQRED
jgi:type IV pilus assembly protein PilW